MLVYFNNFWRGFTECKDPVNVYFFIKLLSKVYNTEILVGKTLEESDILVESIFGDNTYLRYKLWKSTFLFTGESHYSPKARQNLELYTCILGFQPTLNNFVECPLFIPYMICNPYEYKINDNIPKNNASVVISSNNGNIRNYFLDKLEKKINVFYGGNYKNNIGGPIQGSYNSQNLLSFYGKTKFAITMENSKEDFYITEKIINGFRAGVIPIYWGSSNVTKYFNSDRFLILKSNSDIDVEELIQKMVNMTDEEYINIIHQPIFKKSIDILFEELVSSIKSII